MPRMLRAAQMKLERIITRSADGRGKLYLELTDGSGEEIEFVPEKPFDYLYALEERDWWKDNFETQANIMAVAHIAGNRKAAAPEQWLTGSDSAVARSDKELLAANAEDANYSLMAGGSATSGQRQQPPAPRGAPIGAPARAPKAPKAPKTPAYRQKACPHYNQNSCRGGRCDGQVCPADPARKHICSNCGRAHPFIECFSVGGPKAQPKGQHGKGETRKRKGTR